MIFINGWCGFIRKWWHSFQLAMLFRCYLNRSDMKFVTFGSCVAGGIFLALVYAVTFHYKLSNLSVGLIYCIDVIILLFVIYFARSIVTAEMRLDKRYIQWKKDFVKWCAQLDSSSVSSALETARTPIDG